MKKVIAIVGIVMVGAAAGYAAFYSMIPVNRDFPVLGVPANHYIKSVHSNGASAFVLSSTKGAKKGFTVDHKPTLSTNLGDLVAFHMINEDKEKHNLNLDEFNVHTKDLGYFETQSITFVADKAGQYTFHCTLHPEMSGTLIVE